MLLKNESNSVKIDFEVVPRKIDYETDYKILTEDIAEKCSELLLDYASPTNLTFQNDMRKAKSPLEQFIFIKHFCSEDTIEYFLTCIKSNPDRMLVSENEMKVFGKRKIAKSFYKKPFANSRNWILQNDKTYIPAQIISERRFDSFDTPANRFIKFALLAFENICDCVIDYLKNENQFLTYYTEASALKKIIDNSLQDSFFDDIQDLDFLPTNNQVLQKRNGYRQILSAFCMLDMALQLNWQGQEDAFEGEARNIALLYEYWLIFQLIDILKELGAVFSIEITKETKIDSMLSSGKNGELLISIKEGKTSLLCFHLPKEHLKINFYYNRTFNSTDFANTDYEGSYSREFRPDYTIAIFSDVYETEKNAVKDGDVSFIHFDAKYRVSAVTELFGKEQVQAEDFDREKTDEISNTYKRGDLLKMHTYNDAIRKTIGSYVLYPGTNKESTKLFNVYDELLPGVGAFAIRPGDNGKGKNAIKTFISDIICFKSEKSSRQFRNEFFENIVIKSPSKNRAVNNSNFSSNIITLGFLRNSYNDFLKTNNYLPSSSIDKTYLGKAFYYYFYAIRDGFVYPIHKNLSSAKYLICSLTDFGKTHIVKTENWIAEIESIELVDVKTLENKLFELGYKSEGKHKAQFYYLMKVKNVRYCESQEVDFLKYLGNDVLNAYSPKIIKSFGGSIYGNSIEELGS